MTDFGDRVDAAVLSILSKFGISATYNYSTLTANGPGGVVTSSADTASITSSPPIEVDEKLIESGTYNMGDAYVYIAVQVFEPKIGDTITVAGSEWTVVNTKAFYSDETISAWELILRR